MPYPNYYDPIITDALDLAGMNRSSYDALVARSNASQQTRPGPYSAGGITPITGRQDPRAYVAKRNAVENDVSGLYPYFQQSQQMDAIRREEDLNKFRRDYRSKLYGNRGQRSQVISGTGARITGVPTPSGGYGSSSLSSGGISAAAMGDPVTRSFQALSSPTF